MEINKAIQELPQPKPWTGAKGVPSGAARPEPVQRQQRQMTTAENAVATHLGIAGIPMEAAAKLAVIIIELRSEVEYLRGRVRELVRE